MSEQDHSQKQLFSFPVMVRDLLVGFVPEPFIQELDFTTLERTNASYISDDLREREDDIIWKVRWKGRWLYIYILLEFQSTVDPFMAVRMMVYIGLLYQDLIRTGQVKASEKLPPVLPLVLYNGGRKWNAAREMAELIGEAPEGMQVYLPRLRYLLLEESEYTDEELKGQDNLAAALIRLENSQTPQVVREVVDQLSETLKGSEGADLGRAFTNWLSRILAERAGGVKVPEAHNLQEVSSMLAERVVEWTQQWKEEGRLEGRQEGRQEGWREGRQEGKQEGRQEGRQEGIQEGIQEGKQQGEAELLIVLLAGRFGALPDEVERRLREADSAMLLEWGARVLTAERLEDVIGIVG